MSLRVGGRRCIKHYSAPKAVLIRKVKQARAKKGTTSLAQRFWLCSQRREFGALRRQQKRIPALYRPLSESFTHGYTFFYQSSSSSCFQC